MAVAVAVDVASQNRASTAVTDGRLVEMTARIGGPPSEPGKWLIDWQRLGSTQSVGLRLRARSVSCASLRLATAATAISHRTSAPRNA